MSKTTVIHHSADFDGIFCREIARKFLPSDTEFIGWDFRDAPLSPGRIVDGDTIYVMDLPIDRVFGITFPTGPAPVDYGNQLLSAIKRSLIWIDHHKSSIDTHPKDIPGYRIDGVAACRLAWQWFSHYEPLVHDGTFKGCPVLNNTSETFVNRQEQEPLAVRLAGEYDVWDKRDPRAETFQYALRCKEPNFTQLLGEDSSIEVKMMLEAGEVAQTYARKVDASICNSVTWIMEWEGLKFLCVNHARFNSLLFAAKDVPETGHDALLGFRFDGKQWTVSLYHANHRKDIDLSEIAKRHGGGGHRGACGFVCKTLPFQL